MLILLAITGILAQSGQAADWLAELARIESLQRQDKGPEVEAALATARRMVDGIGGDELPSAVVSYQAGSYYFKSARFLEAEREFERAVEIFNSELGPAHHISVEAAIQLSSTYLETSQISKAATLLRRHLECGGKLSQGDRAALLGDLASVLMYQGRPDEAERRYLEALSVFETNPRPQSRERTLIALSNLSGIYLSSARIPQAIALAERANELLATLPGVQPTLRVKTLANTAAAYAAAKSEPQKADQLFQSAIRSCEQAFGPDHFLLGPILANYADFLKSIKRKADASAAQRRGAAIQAAFVRQNLLGHTVDAATLRAASSRPAAGSAK